MIGNGPLPRGLKTVASRGLSPCRRYSTSATSMSYVVCVPMAISGLPFLVGYGICMSLVDIDTFCPRPPSRRRHPQLARSSDGPGAHMIGLLAGPRADPG